MYQSVTHDNGQGGRLTIDYSINLATLIRIVYEAGRMHRGVLIDEYAEMDDGGARWTRLFTSHERRLEP